MSLYQIYVKYDDKFVFIGIIEVLPGEDNPRHRFLSDTCGKNRTGAKQIRWGIVGKLERSGKLVFYERHSGLSQDSFI